MAHEEPKIRIETREELIYLLAEAAAILLGVATTAAGYVHGLVFDRRQTIASPA